MKSLRDTILEFGDSQSELAHVLGITEATMSAKLRGKAEFKQSEIKAIAERYNLTGEEIRYMFSF